MSKKISNSFFRGTSFSASSFMPEEHGQNAVESLGLGVLELLGLSLAKWIRVCVSVCVSVRVRENCLTYMTVYV